MSVVDTHGHWGKKISTQSTKDEGVVPPPDQPHHEAMNDMNREEVKARLDASEARVASAVEGMRGDNDRLRHQIDRLALSLENSNSTSRLEFSSFKSEVLQATQAAQFSVRDEVHKLRAWVLTGALTGVLALLGFVASNFMKANTPTSAPDSSPASAQPAVPHPAVVPPSSASSH